MNMEVPVTSDQLEYLVALFPVLLEAVRNSHWLVIGGAVISGLTYLFKHYALSKIALQEYILPGVVVLLSLIGAMGMEAMETNDQGAAIAVFLGGLGSIPLYDMIRGWLKDKGYIK